MAIAYSTTERNAELDEFLTPEKLVTACVAQMEFEMPLKVLDPGANLGQWGAGVKARFSQAVVWGVELMDIGQPSSFDVWVPNQDFLAWETPERFGLIVCNPPYSNPKKNMAELFVRKSLSLLAPGGFAYFLLRTNFGNAKQRSRGLFKEHPLKELWFCDRPSFYEEDRRTEQYGKKRTNMHDYSIYVWQRGFDGVPIVKWLLWDEKKTVHNNNGRL